MRVLCVFGRYAYGNRFRGEGYEYSNFIPALRKMGHELELFDTWDRTLYADFSDLNRKFVERVYAFKPNVVFCVLMGYELWTETLDLVRTQTDSALLNWGTDDSWKYSEFARFIAPHVDLYATTAQSALAASQADGLSNFVLTQWAANDEFLNPPLPSSQCQYDVTFVGSAYGNRRAWIEHLRDRGVAVECFGHGWKNGPVSAERIPEIYRRSKISLNFADSGLHFRGLVPYRSKQVKARVFEVPGAGGMLLTESADSMERYYLPDVEIACFRSVTDLAQKIALYLEDEGARNRIAHAGFERTRRQHTYVARFHTLFDEARRLKAESRTRGEASLPSEIERSLDVACAQHRIGFWMKLFRKIIVALAVVFAGRVRGPRGARRLLFELCWRLCGRKTYGARGLPGRLFYHQS